MQVPKLFLKKNTYIVFAIAFVGAGWFAHSQFKSKAPTFELVAVERRDLVQTVDVTGELKPAARIELAFKTSGTIEKINVKVGDRVNVGDVLAALKADEALFAARHARAALAVAEANVKIRLSGESPQSIRVAAVAVEQAQRAYEKAAVDLESVQRTTQDSLKNATVALQTAQNNLNNQSAIVNQTVQNAYDSARTILLNSLGPLNTGLTDGDQISGVENTAANQTFLPVLGFLDSGSLDRAKSSYRVAKDAKRIADTRVNAMSVRSSTEEIQLAAASVQAAITLAQSYLTDVQRVLAASLTNSFFTSSDLTAKKATIDADRVSVSAQSTNVLGALQSIKNTELAKTQTAQSLQDALQTASAAYDTAKTNADVSVRSAEATVFIQKSAIIAAKATLDLKQSLPREVDLASFRAAAEQAAVAFEKAQHDVQNVQIIAPAMGTISEVIYDIGEQVAQHAVVMKLIGMERYELEAKVPEADVAKVMVGQMAAITLDAYGDDVKFSGTVTAKDPAETRLQDAIYYKIRVQLDSGGHELRPGMTTNVTIHTSSTTHALVLPLRAIRTKDEIKLVRVFEGGIPKERPVRIGVRGDEGRVEILSGVQEGEQVIVSEAASTKK